MIQTTLNTVWSSLLKLQFDIRTWHWRTKSYAQHMAFGEAYDALSPLLDDLAESSISYQQIFDIDFESVSSNQTLVKSKDVILSQIKSVIDLLNENEFGFNDLDNIKDEIQQVLSLLYYKISELS